MDIFTALSGADDFYVALRECAHLFGPSASQALRCALSGCLSPFLVLRYLEVLGLDRLG